MVNKYFKAYKKGKEIVETLKGTGKKTKLNYKIIFGKVRPKEDDD